MSKTVLIAGGHPGLAAALAARHPNAHLGMPQSTPDEIDAIWWLPTGHSFLDRPAESALLDMNVGIYNIAAPCGYGDGFAARCAEHGYRWRLFEIPPTVDGSVPPPCGVPRLLATLAGVIDEVTQREPEYFKNHPLRLALPPSSPAPVVDPSPIADVLSWLAAEPYAGNTHYRVDVQNVLPVHEVVAALGEAWGISLDLVLTSQELAPIDRYAAALLTKAARECDRPVNAAARCVSVAGVDRQRHVTLMRSAGNAYKEHFQVGRDRAAAIPDLLEPSTVDVGGTPLTYFTCGSAGPPIVILNALGQGLEYWYPLIEKLLPRHKVLLWTTRELTASGSPATFSDHVDDVAAVLANENIDRCHLLGWCTGAKVAIEFYRRQPSAVKSMLFLNGAFKQPGRPEEFDSDYERNLEAMCLSLVRNPQRAGKLRQLFGSGMYSSANAHEDVNVLTSTHPRLLSEVNAPFASDEILVRYAHQHLDFWSQEVLEFGSSVRVPVLFAASEYDQVVTPAGIRAAADHFPTGRFVEMPGATHHRMYDRPDLVAELIAEFISRPVSTFQYV